MCDLSPAVCFSWDVFSQAVSSIAPAFSAGCNDDAYFVDPSHMIDRPACWLLWKSQSQPKDGRKDEWISACCVPGVSPPVVSLPAHHSG